MLSKYKRKSWMSFIALGMSTAGCQEISLSRLDSSLTSKNTSPNGIVITPGTNPSPSPSPSTSPSPSPSPVANCYTDEFQQPAEQISRSVDILFVADTSGSMSNKRVKVANALGSFVGALPAGTDYRIGVILAHGSNDPNTGRLYTSSRSIPQVLDSSLLSQATIQNNLKQIMLAAPDYQSEEGEMGSYALIKALSSSRLEESRNLGFFRKDAALAIVTISDENDICTVYPNPIPSEYKLNHDLYRDMPGISGSEKAIRKRDCSSGISSNQVINAVKAVQGDRPYIMGAVIHTNLNYYNSRASNDSYGWGYGQLVSASHGALVDIDDADYSAGLASLGELTSTKIQLNSDFTLSHQNVAANTINVTVDRNAARFDYNESQNEVHLFDLGSALSRIEINYCLK